MLYDARAPAVKKHMKVKVGFILQHISCLLISVQRIELFSECAKKSPSGYIRLLIYFRITQERVEHNIGR